QEILYSESEYDDEEEVEELAPAPVADEIATVEPVVAVDNVAETVQEQSETVEIVELHKDAASSGEESLNSTEALAEKETTEKPDSKKAPTKKAETPTKKTVAS